MKKFKMLLFCFLIASISQVEAQSEGQQLLQQTFNTWKVLQTNIQIHSLKNETSPNKVKTMGGSGTFFGQSVGLEVAFKTGNKKEIRKVIIDFPEMANLNTDQFRAIFGKNMNDIFPQGFGAKIGIRHFQIHVRNKKVIKSNIVLNFGTWAPDKNNQKLVLSDIEAGFTMTNLQSQRRNIKIKLRSYLFLPEKAAKFVGLGVGNTKLKVKGIVDTRTKKIVMGVNLSSDEIPIDINKVLVLKEAQFAFSYEPSGRINISLGGDLELRPTGVKPVTFKGELSLDLVKGKVYGEAFMDHDTPWKNPFGLNDKITITKAGIGFGVNFFRPIPTPSLAIEGGVEVRDDNKNLCFSGGLTFALDLGDISQNMIDAQVRSLNMKHLVDAFHTGGTPTKFAKSLKKLKINNLHFRLVPPGNGITVFGQHYEPGFYAEGKFTYEEVKGAFLMDIDEDGVEMFAGISDVNLNGLKFTGATPNTKPHFYLGLKPSKQVFVMAINGKMEILGSSSLADIYFSDAGFSATTKTTIMGGFTTELDIAGTNLLKGGSVYLKASMTDRDNLVQKITEMASDEIERKADENEAQFNKWDKELKRYQPLYEQKERELTILKNKIRAEYKQKCSLWNQKQNQEKEKRNKEIAIRNLKSEIQRLQSRLNNDRYRRAKALKTTNCPSGSVKDLGYCWTCPSGYKRDPLQRIDGSKACFKPASSIRAGAIVVGNRPLIGACPGGQFTNAFTGKCYKCPSGYKQLVAETDLKKACIKRIPVKYAYAKKGKSVKCGGRSFQDIGKCWECPSGYARKVSVHRVDSDKACELTNITSRQASIDAKKRELAKLESSYVIITKGLGKLAAELTGVASDVCQKVNETDAMELTEPRVRDSQIKRDRDRYKSLAVDARKNLQLLKTLSVGSVRATAWLVKNGGSALSVVDIDKASFEGCLSVVKGGYVKIAVKGSFADSPINTSFDINLRSPEAGIKAFADALWKSNNLPKVRNNGSCTRPNVPRPEPEGKIKELLKFVNTDTDSKLNKGVRGKKKRPGWAKKQFK